MRSETYEQKNRTLKRLGIHPLFEGIVLSHWDTQVKEDLEKLVRKSVLFDAAESAIAYSNLWDVKETKYWLRDTVRYVLENRGNPNKDSYPTIEKLCKPYSGESIDDITEKIFGLLEKGVRQKHEGMGKLLSKKLIGGKYGEPHLTEGAVLSAKVGRRGDERKDKARQIRMLNGQVIDDKVNITGFQIADPSPLYRDNLGKERRHGYNPDVVQVVSFQTALLCHYINKLSPEKKKELGFREDYKVFMPYKFEGNERLVIEALAKRYVHIKGQPQTERNIFNVSTWLDDHPEIFTDLTNKLLEQVNASVGVGKLLFEDKPHRNLLRKIENLLVNKELGYRFNGFSVDFRDYGKRFQTESIVYSTPDGSRNVHIIYDSKFEYLPLLLLKLTPNEWGKTFRNDLKMNVKRCPETSPFKYNQWYLTYDRHSQQKVVNMIIRPDGDITKQLSKLMPEYQRFEQQLRK